MKFPFMKDKNNNKIETVDIDKIISNPYQPRTDFDEESLKDLAESIDNFGIIQPLTIRSQGEEYELIAGERRLKAAKLAGLNEVPVIIKDFDNQETAEIALVENLQRKDLDFLEEAHAYEQLLDEFDLTQGELAKRIGKSQSTIANKLRILKLDIDIQRKIKNPQVSERHARILLKIKDKNKQKEIVNRIIDEKLTVRETEKIVKKFLNTKNNKKNNVKTAFKNLRPFTNSLNKTINEMKKAGLEVEVSKNKNEEYIEYNIKLPRKRGEQGGQ
ncbi:MAG: nucleoid occlusion protein [Bacillota bacterium]